MTTLLWNVIAQIEQELSPEEQDELARELERQFAVRRAANERQRRLNALDRLVELSAGLPPVDAVRVVRNGRKELEKRVLR